MSENELKECMCLLPSRVMQDRFGVDGNCFDACIASILGVSLSSVDYFRDQNTWYADLQNWLSPRGLAYVEIDVAPHNPLYRFPRPVLAIAGGPSPRGIEGGHAVVVQCSFWDRTLIHDPHPSGEGLSNIRTLGFLVATSITTEITQLKQQLEGLNRQIADANENTRLRELDYERTKQQLLLAEVEAHSLRACLKVSTAPCGHSDQYLYSPDGVGEVVHCYACQLAAKTEELERVKQSNETLRDALLRLYAATRECDAHAQAFQALYPESTTATTEQSSADGGAHA